MNLTFSPRIGGSCLKVAFIFGSISLATATEPVLKELVTPSNPGGADGIAISQKYVVMGSALEDVGSVLQAGRARVWDAVSGKLVREFQSTTPAANAQFGSAVAIRGTVALIGEQRAAGGGKAYLIDLAKNVVLQTYTPTNATPSALTGARVAFDGQFVVLGAPGDNGNRGAVFVFNQATGAQLFKMVPSDVAAGDSFGTALDISGGIMVAGSPGDDAFTGSIYCFDLITGNQVQKTIATDSAPNRNYGESVALSGRLAVVGSSRRDNDRGSIYIVEPVTGVERYVIQHPGAISGDSLGGDLAVDGNLIVASSTVLSNNRGGARFFDLVTGAYLGNLSSMTFPYFGSKVALYGGRLATAGGYSFTTTKAYTVSFVAAPQPDPVQFTKGQDAHPTQRVAFGLLKRAAVTPTGKSLFHATLTGTDSNRNRDQGIYEVDGTLSEELRSRFTLFLLPGTPTPSVFSDVMQNQTAEFLARVTLAGSSISTATNECIVSNFQTFQKGTPIGEFSNAVASKLGQLAQSTDAMEYWVTGLTLKTGVAGVTTGTDSALMARTTGGGVVVTALQEGGPAGTTGANYGQMTGRITAMDHILFSTALQGDPALNQAVFRQEPLQPTQLIARKGDPAPVIGGTFSTFLGETLSVTERSVFRATLTGSVPAQNEGLWSSNGYLVAKNTLAPGLGTLVVKKIIGFWAVRNQVLVHVQLGGTGVNGGNDSALYLYQEDGSALLLLREGALAPQCADGARWGALLRIEVNPDQGYYAVLATLAGAASDANQALFIGRTLDGNATTQRGARLPTLLARKGTRHLVPFGGTINKIRSINLPVSLMDASGAGTRGNAQTFSNSGHLIYTIDFDNKVQQHVLHPVN
jgi:hypothetical protein